MKIILLFVLTSLLNTTTVYSQGKGMPMPDTKRLMAMSPSERQRYADSLTKAYSKIAVSQASQMNVAIDETILPGIDIKPPVKDVGRLSLIPSRPPTRNELVSQIQKSQQQLRSVMQPSQAAELEKFSNSKNVAQIHEASIGTFYNNNPERALYLMMEVAKKRPDSVTVWNNLGAMYNQIGLHHRAVPVLQYSLEQVSGSAVILNNLGQSYMGLGDLEVARKYFIQCLDIDSLNPDANHSMGLLYMFDNEFDNAMKHFNRELSIAMRRSTIAYAAKMGKKPDLRALMKKKNAYNGRPVKNYFGDINLGKFSLPAFPPTVIEAYKQVEEFKAFTSSVGEEALYWMSRGTPSTKQIEEDGKQNHGIYSDLVQVLLEELDNEFTPEYLSNIDDNDVPTGLEIRERWEKELRIAREKCAKAPAGSSIETQLAYEIKCCEEKLRRIVDNQINEYGSFWRGKIDVAQVRWQAYINEAISIVRLDPSLANRLMINKMVGQYFAFLGRSSLYSGTADAVHGTLLQCKENFSLEAADSIIESARNWQLDCPAWLNVEVDVEVAKIKADCSKYSIEAGNSIVGQFEHDFKTGSNTLLLGYGVKASFAAKAGKASLKQMAFITFDKNNQFADFGTRAKAEVGIGDTPFNVGPLKVGGTILGVEGVMQNSINGGFTSYVKGKGVIADFIKIDRSL